jgi:drug/metabolite transporter (DMT)-like permease
MTRRGLLLFASMCVIWGIPYLFIRIAVRELSPATLVLGRTSIATLVLVPLAVRRGGLRDVVARWLPLLAFAAIEIALPWLLLASAERRISSSLTGLLIAGVPIVGTVIAVALGDRRHMSAVNIAGLLVGIGGVAAIVGFDLHTTSGVALVEVALVAVCYALGPAILARYLSDLPSVGVIALSVAVCAIAYAPVAAFQLPSRMPSAEILTSVAVLALVCTAFAFILFFALIAEVGPVRATVITYVNPAVAALLGVTTLGEGFTAGMGIGFVLVLAGSVLATRRAPELRAGPVVAEP